MLGAQGVLYGGLNENAWTGAHMRIGECRCAMWRRCLLCDQPCHWQRRQRQRLPLQQRMGA